MDIVKCFISLVILLLVFYYWGNISNNIARLGLNHWIEKTLVGFFIYSVLFQFLSLYMIITFRPFTMLCVVWCIFVVVISIILFRFYEKANKKPFTNKLSIALFLLFLVVIIRFIVTQPYMGWDTVHYVGVMNESVYTDTMYCFNPDNGSLLKELKIKDVLNSGFFMQFAIISKIIGVKPLIVAYYLMRSLGVCLCVGVLYLIGNKLYKNVNKALIFSAGVILMNICFSTILSTEFFNLRLYEGKGFCQNVIIPATIYCFILMWIKQKNAFKLLFIIGLASVPISMSSVLIFPFMVGVFCLCLWTMDIKNYSVLYRGAICTIPNIIYFVLYYLNTSDKMILEIK